MLCACGLLWEVDRAAFGFGAGNLDGFTGNDARQGRLQMLAVLTERAFVGDGPVVRADHEHFTGSRDTQRLANDLGRVHQHRNIEAELFGFSRDAGTIILETGVDHEKLHALRGVLVAQRLDGRQRLRDQRTIVGLRHQYDGFRVAEVVKLMGRTKLVQEPEIIDSILRAQSPARNRNQER